MIETITYKNFIINIEYDEHASDLREWDNLGIIATWHRNYRLGDVQPKESLSEWLAAQGKGVYSPVYMYEHGGICIKTTPFSCRWDSEQLGVIFISDEKIKKEYGKKRISKKFKAKIESYLEDEIKTYNQYIMGEVYRYSVLDSEDNILDSCSGYYELKDAIHEAKSFCDYQESIDLPLLKFGGVLKS